MKIINWLLRCLFKLGMISFMLMCAFYVIAILFGAVALLHLPDKVDIVGRMGVCGIVAVLLFLSSVACDVLSNYFKKM